MGITVEHPSLDTIRINLQNFKDAMKGDKAPAEDVMANSQRLMLSTLKTLFRQEDEVFIKGMRMVSDWVRENIDDCMQAKSRFRGLIWVKEMSVEDQNALKFLVNLLCMLADPAARKLVLARVDMGRLDKFWVTGNQSDKLRSFFES